MAAFDFKKDRKDLYRPTTSPSIAEVPEMLFIAVDGKGDPNTSAEFRKAMELLYGLSYTIRMNKTETNYFAYVVPPLEGFWDAGDKAVFSANGPVADKQKLVWTVVIRQPAFVTADVFLRAKAALAKKKPQLNTELARLQTIAEGLCVQAMHLGPYDTESATIQAMNRYREQRGFKADYTSERRHHEIYLSNPQRCAPETMKTILRLPIKKRR